MGTEYYFMCETCKEAILLDKAGRAAMFFPAAVRMHQGHQWRIDVDWLFDEGLSIEEMGYIELDADNIPMLRNALRRKGPTKKQLDNFHAAHDESNSYQVPPTIWTKVKDRWNKILGPWEFKRRLFILEFEVNQLRMEVRALRDSVGVLDFAIKGHLDPEYEDVPGFPLK